MLASAQEESIVIDDLSLSELNDQIERVEDEFYRVFNLSIEEEHLKVECADWTPTGTHIAQRACQPYFLSQARNQNLRDWNNQMDVIASPEQMRVRLAAEFEELTAAINSVLEENQYLRELHHKMVGLRSFRRNKTCIFFQLLRLLLLVLLRLFLSLIHI